MRKLLIFKLCLLMSASLCAQSNVVPDATEFAVLKALWESTSGSSWTTKTNWPTAGNWPSSATAAQMDDWHGITVTNGDITEIVMVNNQLTGPLPASLSNLTKLKKLSFPTNKLWGEIPASLGTIPTLEIITMNDNELSGSIPAELGSLNNLTHLLLYNNMLSGSVPSQLGSLSHLNTLYLSNNKLSGSLPDSFSGLTSLANLSINGNRFSGTIPNIFSTMTLLSSLNLSDNRFSGELPPLRGSVITVSNNQFTGAFPSISAPSSVVSVIASGNGFTSLPSSVMSWTNVATLNFAANELTGLPTSFNTHSNRANLVLNVTSNRLDYSVIVPYESAGFKSPLSVMPQKNINKELTHTLVPGQALSLETNPTGSGTVTVTWQKQDGSGNWSDLTYGVDEDPAMTTFGRTSATTDDQGTYRWKMTNSTFSGTTLYSEAIQVKTAVGFVVDNWAFQYKYDGRHRMTHKKVPGADWVYMVYDDRDRLVLTQDGNQRPKQMWSFTKYDELNRPIMTGIMDYTSVVSQETMQSTVDQFYAQQGVKWGEAQEGTVHYYTNNTFPNVSDPYKYLTVTYYDNYAWKDNIYDGGRLSFKPNALDGQKTAINDKVIGLPTGSKVKVLDGSGTWGGSTWLMSGTYYDDKQRVIQTVSDNYKGGTDRVTNILDFVGRVRKTRTTHETYDVSWKDRVAVNPIGDRIAATSTSSGVASVDRLAASTIGWIEVTVGRAGIVDPPGTTAQASTYGWMIGLSSSNTNANTNTINYAIGVGTDGKVKTGENGNFTDRGTAVQGDVLRVERTGTTVKFYRNGGNSIATANASSTSALLIDAGLTATTSIFSNVRASFAKTSQSTTRYFVYDHAGRLLKIWHHLNEDDSVLLVSNEYNELGQLVDKKLHSTEAGTDARQSLDYRYNIRGWMTSINGAELGENNKNDDEGQRKDLFGMDLLYNNVESGLSNSAMYNGNISAMKWSNNVGVGSVKQNAYKYSYDTLNRIKSAGFTQQQGSSWSNSSSMYSESGYGYDLNGNIKNLTRKDKTGASMDVLSYDYGTGMDASNRLLKVADTGDKNQGFVDGINTDNDYGYDNNGNMVFDQNKGITTAVSNIKYNHLNLPEYVNRGGNTIRYIYDATGRKLAQAVVFMGVGDKRTDYSGEFEYENDVMKFVNTEEGRIVVGKQEQIYSNSCEDVSTVTNVNSKVTTFTENGEKYFRVTATGTSSGTGLFPIGNTIRVNNGDRYLIRAKGYQTGGSVSYIHAKVNGTNLDYPYVSIPNRDGTESWSEQIITIPGGAADTTLQVGVTWPTTNTTQVYYLNEFEVIKLESQGAEYQYHLKDHLGNVRMTFTTRDETESMTATMEASHAVDEDKQFLNYDNARFVTSTLFDATNGNSPGRAQRLSGGDHEKIGLAKSFSVMPGDTIRMRVLAKYFDASAPNLDAALQAILTALANPASSGGVVVDKLGYGTAASTSIPWGLGEGNQVDQDVPKAYLNFIFINRDFDVNSVDPDFKAITEAALEDGTDVPHETLSLTKVIREAGYVYVFLSNDEENEKEVYFDDFRVEHIKSPVIESQSYYPLGLTFDHFQRESSTRNQYLYNQGAGNKKFHTERIIELDLNVDQSKYRTYDYITGRWWQVDPKADAGGQESWSTYQFAFDNPIRYNDPEGDCLPFCAPLIPLVVEGVIAVTEVALAYVAAEMTMTVIEGTTQSSSSETTTQSTDTDAPVITINSPTVDKQSKVDTRSASDQKLIDLAKQETAKKEAAKARAGQRQAQTKKGKEKEGTSNQGTRGSHDSGSKSKADQQRHQKAETRRAKEQKKADEKKKN